MKKIDRRIALIAALIVSGLTLYPSPSLAACYSGHPAPKTEFRESKLVMIGKVVSSKDVMSGEDPDTVGRTVYTVEARRIYKGHARPVISIVSENTSSRFPMDKGVDYLLFVSEYRGEYFVDACGNSGRIDDSRSLMKELGLHH